MSQSPSYLAFAALCCISVFCYSEAVDGGGEAERFISAAFPFLSRGIDKLCSSGVQQEVSDGEGLIPSFLSCRQRLCDIYKDKSSFMSYIDAMGKPGSGILLGNTFMLGSYQQCKETIRGGHYCMVKLVISWKTLNSSKGIEPTWGLCVPMECGPKDLFSIFNNVTATTGIPYLSSDVHIVGNSSDSITCDKEKDTSSAGFVVTVVICTAFVIMGLLGTIIDHWFTYQKLCIKIQYSQMNDALPEDCVNNTVRLEATEPQPDVPQSMLLSRSIDDGALWLRIFRCLSITRNARVILSTDVPKGAITSINGVRLFSMWWVILGHTYGFTAGNSDNLLIAKNVLHRFTFLAVLNGVYSVDSFFFLSGLLVSYLTLRRIQSKGNLSWVQFYVHRYLRLTPSYALVILCFIYIVPLILEGPTVPMLETAVNGCRKLWWTNLLYINNFYKMDFTGCVAWTWYLANDMQFFIISPIIIILMSRLKWIGVFATNGILLIGSFIATGLLISKYNLISDSYGHRAEVYK